MAPEPRIAFNPGSDVGPSDFELAGQLYYAILYREGAISGETIAALFRNALSSDDACFVLSEERHSLQGAWSELLNRAEERGSLVYQRNATDDKQIDSLGFPLVFREEMLGFIGIAGKDGGYDQAAIRRFADLASLLAGMLHARFSHDQRIAALASSETEVRRQTQMLDQIRDSVITMDLDGYINGWNRGAEQLFGYSAAEIIGKNILTLYADTDEDDPLFNAFLENGSHEMNVRRRKKSGEIFWASVSLSVAQDEAAMPTGLIGYVVDISERLAAEEKLHLHAKIFEHNSEAVLVTDSEQRIVSTNHAFSLITGYTETEALGKHPDMLNAKPEQALLTRDIRQQVDAGKQWSGELQFQRKNGESFPVGASVSSVHDLYGALGHYFLVFSDITERKDAERQIYRLAYYDPLTGLPNRTLFYSLLEQALTEAHRNRTHGAVLFLDLNRFKNINDSFGHTPADAILREVGRRLSTTLRSQDVVSRLGGDEFVVALPDISRREHAGHVAQKLLAALAEPFFVEQHEVLLSASIGVSIFPEDGRDTETLLKNADVAMYRAKKLGSSTHVFYSQEMNLRSLDRLKLEGNLRRAVERGELCLHYQPQLDLASGRITGAEALLRWFHPEQGLISPAQFIPVAEETGLIIPIGEWVIDAACRQIRAWIDQGLPPVRVAVNLSTRQFSATLPRTVLAIIARHGIPTDSLELEITESMLMHNADSVVAMMREFGDAGILMALDDFGTGYSSLSYLKRFPIDNLKIDQSFVRGIPTDPDDSAIARAIISMAKNLRLSVIAEGVETLAQMEFLRDAGCDEIQGYYFSRPIPADEFAALLTKTNR
jgi:diguanylate cyclase (GGDEF)-like protein/PAS domain S-box-containing protein